MNSKIQKFSNSDKFFQCPVCGKKLELKNNSLYCENNHCFDISKKGFVDFVLNNHQSKNYDLASFENRHLILEHGMYDHIADKLVTLIDNLKLRTILDVGCGEGYYSKKIAQLPDKDVLAFDISKDSIQLAAKGPDSFVKWFVGDLAHLPIQNQSIAGIIDIFSPANYGEFNRILQKDGYVLKVIPNEYHVQELREQAKDQLQQANYSNEKVLNYFEEHYQLVDKIDATKTYPVNNEEKNAFIKMTPLLFNVDNRLIDWESVDKITVGSTILVGQK
ncbi:putative RNA methyltransferase [Companilactobacillus halodurans]|uniref:Methyltransferase domain-containing protein n=1 Tax=Companilactobacillus halodurans TaxID=2584183 RepID=A0A5P0ZWQ5_9LACO|nr:methyltransferase domain-containing protein [Companilactobacillus halodurans]MQS75390.1 methyltransferase domain-containing protein [Companilactobacillus halodurans]MQS97335.1 methyltransferase domain-containing protein [Companilactobacillus halodurans]